MRQRAPPGQTGAMTMEQTQVAPSGEGADTYNYLSFDYRLEAAELERWRLDGPAAGQLAPEFELAYRDGNLVRLSDLRGRPTVLEFGSPAEIAQAHEIAVEIRQLELGRQLACGWAVEPPALQLGRF